MTKQLPAFENAIAAGTYSASASWRFRAAPEHVELAAMDRGYGYDEEDISSAFVKRQYNVLARNLDECEFMKPYRGVMRVAYTKPNGNHVVVDFKVEE